MFSNILLLNQNVFKSPGLENSTLFKIHDLFVIGVNKAMREIH